MKNIKRTAKLLENKGRKGDKILAHINPREAMLLDRVTDGGSINPYTGLMEFEWGGAGPGDYSGFGDDESAGGPTSSGGDDGGGGGAPTDIDPNRVENRGLPPGVGYMNNGNYMNPSGQISGWGAYQGPAASNLGPTQAEMDNYYSGAPVAPSVPSGGSSPNIAGLGAQAGSPLDFFGDKAFANARFSPASVSGLLSQSIPEVEFPALSVYGTNRQLAEIRGENPRGLAMPDFNYIDLDIPFMDGREDMLSPTRSNNFSGHTEPTELSAPAPEMSPERRGEYGSETIPSGVFAQPADLGMVPSDVITQPGEMWANSSPLMDAASQIPYVGPAVGAYQTAKGVYDKQQAGTSLLSQAESYLKSGNPIFDAAGLMTPGPGPGTFRNAAKYGGMGINAALQAIGLNPGSTDPARAQEYITVAQARGEVPTKEGFTAYHNDQLDSLIGGPYSEGTPDPYQGQPYPYQQMASLPPTVEPEPTPFPTVDPFVPQPQPAWPEVNYAWGPRYWEQPGVFNGLGGSRYA